MIMRRVAFHIFATLGCLLSLGSAALAQEAPVVGTYSISPLDRQQFGEFDPFAPYLTGRCLISAGRFSPDSISLATFLAGGLNSREMELRWT